MTDYPLDLIPMWVVLLGTVSVIRLAIELGYRVAERQQSQGGKGEAPVRTLVAALLALLAFMLTFTFGAAASRFDTRKILVVKEANAIATAYRTADLLPSAQVLESKRLLREYVDSRAGVVEASELEAAIARSEELHIALWEQALSAAREAPASAGTRLFTLALNTVFDLHEERVVAGVHNRIPASQLVLLYIVAAIAMVAFGYDLGLYRIRRQFLTLALSLAFSVVFMLILDLDRPQAGLLRVSQQSMIELQERMGRADGARDLLR